MPLLQFFPRSLVTLLCLSLGLAATEAQAGSVSHTGTFPLSPYLNSGSYAFPAASFPKFDLAGHCLNSVCVRLDGGIAGLIGFENYENFPKVVTVYFTGTITLQRPDLTPLLTVQPATSTTDSVTSFDNVLDYGGTSGRTYPNVSATNSDSLCLTNSADLALFSGTGTISLPGVATDLSSQTGANSWSIGVKAYATITVTYNYTECSVPVAATNWSRIKGLYR
jgi:hypothetical protein